MKKILAISGSAGANSSNTLLLKSIQAHYSGEYEIEIFDKLREFPLFRPEDFEKGIPELVQELKDKILAADAIIMSTPEYTHNIPAVLKNAFEWMTASGEFAEKKILPITFTPREPRGEHAMQSLLFSLKTMNARIVTQLPLYKSEVKIENGKLELNEDYIFLLEEALKLL